MILSDVVFFFTLDIDSRVSCSHSGAAQYRCYVPAQGRELDRRNSRPHEQSRF
jgi:hypothetical protein